MLQDDQILLGFQAGGSAAGPASVPAVGALQRMDSTSKAGVMNAGCMLVLACSARHVLQDDAAVQLEAG